MSVVNFNLNNGATLAGMAPPALPGGLFGNATLPMGLAGAGMYLIVNTKTNNRYVGISTDLAQRFNTRMATVTELGFSTAQMNRIAVYWGTVQVQNTPTLAIPAPPMTAVAAYGAPLNFMIDGVNVQLERLLIRFVLTQLGAGGTVSNNMMAAIPYTNPTANAITVTLNWGAGGVHFPAGFHTAVWATGIGAAAW